MVKLFDSEIQVMNILWSGGDTPAKEIAEVLARQLGWSKTTSYTVIGKCLKKGALRRMDPGYVCIPLIARADVQMQETDALLDKYYGGAADLLVANLIAQRRLGPDQIEKLRRMIDDMEDEPQ